MSLLFVTGGVRSGKSAYGEKLAEKGAKQRSGTVLYVATGVAADEEMAARIRRHQKRRPRSWALLEAPYDLLSSVQTYAAYDVILVDCLSAWVGNRLWQASVAPDAAEERKREAWHEPLLRETAAWLEEVRALQKTVIVVSTEAGLGGVALSELGRRFQDVLGEVNQLVAQAADEAYFVVSGIPWRIKG
ncbi:bifunctional adenosylcobinamide kinase/adenosylcobinamide-phosphate guanylyltransferase [Bacillaceae bacterium]